MHEYYFKIRKGDIEFECSTTDQTVFEEQLSDWINGIVKGRYVAAPAPTKKSELASQTENVHRSGFIDVKNLTSINEIQTPDFAANFDLGAAEEVISPVEEINFEDALNESIQNPKTEVIEKVDTISEFEQHLQAYTPQNQMDYLIITAIFILNVENQERFSIKQLNSKLVPSTGKPVDHALIQESIEQGFVRIVPDLTGTSEFTEYTLTEQGEGYFVE